MADEIVPLLRNLGLNEYEAKIYAALVGLRKATARDIHEVSAVPRGRIYEILHDLVRRGFIGVIEGTPTSFYLLDPDQVIDRLKEDSIRSLEETREAIHAVSFPQHRSPEPVILLKSEWAIENHLNSLFRKTKDRMTILCHTPVFLQQHLRALRALDRRIDLAIIVRDARAYAGIDLPIYAASGIVAGLLDDQHMITDGVSMECVIFVDEKDFIHIGGTGSERIGVFGSNIPLARYVQRSLAGWLEEEKSTCNMG
ncbi:TrmB family transcriptional regulator [Methanofollis formosanus]|uniref:TrmB family transcriptional regulator n=1 Tax=Methanofollis formosanus TaxID=299308 RepID=A0A8G1A0W9_9EURY|nr:helix-turn-helix domain-containing protein [Methanofollis formosanus]QYZ78995.1 TrmB family transcriptional regulator [Methanofollis formosanus]